MNVNVTRSLILGLLLVSPPLMAQPVLEEPLAETAALPPSFELLAITRILVGPGVNEATMAVLDDGQICASIEVSVRYLRPIPGGRLVATASVIRAGRRIVHLECKVTVDGDERPVALLQGSFAMLEA